MRNQILLISVQRGVAYFFDKISSLIFPIRRQNSQESKGKILLKFFFWKYFESFTKFYQNFF